MQAVIPALRVRSYPKAKVFCGALGFVEQWTHQFEPNFPIFASVIRDGMEIFLTEHVGDCAFGGLVHFKVPDVDALFAEFGAAGVAVAEPPNNDLGPDLRSMAVQDPDGNRLKFLTVKRA